MTSTRYGHDQFKITNVIDGAGQPIGDLIDPGPTITKKPYSATVATLTSDDKTIDIADELGRHGRGGFVANDGTGDFTVKITTRDYAVGDVDAIPVKAGEQLKLQITVPIATMFLEHGGTDSAYRVVIF